MLSRKTTHRTLAPALCQPLGCQASPVTAGTDLADFQSSRDTTCPFVATVATSFPSFPGGYSMIFRARVWPIYAILACCTWGCGSYPHGSLVGQAMPNAPDLQNPMLVPAVDREVVWEQVTRRARRLLHHPAEERVAKWAIVVLEGRIETFPVGGATLLSRGEGFYTRTRKAPVHAAAIPPAVVRVTADIGGLPHRLGRVQELEDLASPQHATVGRRASDTRRRSTETRRKRG